MGKRNRLVDLSSILCINQVPVSLREPMFFPPDTEVQKFQVKEWKQAWIFTPGIYPSCNSRDFVDVVRGTQVVGRARLGESHTQAPVGAKTVVCVEISL